MPMIRNTRARRQPIAAVRPALSCAALALSVTLAACGATVTKHGHHLRPTDLQQVQAGMGEDEVRMALGSPATTSQTANGRS
ncbi:MAG: outer membrane protein assembly factor BamE, partial [Pseudomonadota bacterium]